MVEQERFREAEEVLRRGLKLSWSEPTDLPNQGLAANNLGFCLYHQRRFDEALFYFRRSAELRRRSIGVEHPDYASTLSNLAVIATISGKPAVARDELEKAIEIWEARDPDNPTVSILHNNLAMAMSELGDYEEARQRFEKALEHSQRTFGLRHPETANTHNNLANLLAGLSRFDEALAHHRQALSIWEAERGPHHNHTLFALWSLLDTEIKADLPRGPTVMLASMAELEARLHTASQDPEAEADSIARGVDVLARLYDRLERPDLGQALRSEYPDFPPENISTF